jgi:hypothetical protein
VSRQRWFVCEPIDGCATSSLARTRRINHQSFCRFVTVVQKVGFTVAAKCRGFKQVFQHGGVVE